MANITIIAFGTRGDVQPAIVLGKGLQARGHRVRLLASANFQGWIDEQGLEGAASRVDIQAMMESEGGQEWVERGHNPLVQTRIMKRLFDQHGWGMMLDAWEASRDADLLVSSFTSDAFAVSVAEKLDIPHASMPVQPVLMATRDGRAVANAPLPRRVSRINYLFGKLMIEPYPYQMLGKMNNRLRQEVLGLPPQGLWDNVAARRRMKVVQGVSRYVVPPPADWPDHFHTTGYWFLDEHGDWEPPRALAEFLDSGPPPLSIGFGSMTGRDPARMSEIVLEAVRRSGQRAVLLSGWAGLGESDLPDTVLRQRAVPHGWLFPRVAAVVHHGGAGTTAAGLRAGRPSVIVPHFADQPYWGRRVAALGVGPEPILRPDLTAANLARSIRIAIEDITMRERAGTLARLIRTERGVKTAVDLLDRLV